MRCLFKPTTRFVTVSSSPCLRHRVVRHRIVHHSDDCRPRIPTEHAVIGPVPLRAILRSENSAWEIGLGWRRIHSEGTADHLARMNSTETRKERL